MKKDIHPAYHELEVTCSCGNKFVTHSTFSGGKFRSEVCSKCHPFYTGKLRLAVSGRVDMFTKKYKNVVFQDKTQNSN